VLHFHREESFFEVISRLSRAVDDDGMKNIINVDRDNVLDGAFRGFSRPVFDSRRRLSVKFGGECGLDTGGLTRVSKISIETNQDLMHLHRCWELIEHGP